MKSADMEIPFEDRKKPAATLPSGHGDAVVDLTIDTPDRNACKMEQPFLPITSVSLAAILNLAVSSNNTELLQVVNHKFRDFQRGFTSQGGLPDREFYQHTIFAPGIDTGKSDKNQISEHVLTYVGYAPVTFPGITEAIDAGNFTLAEEWVRKTAAAIRVAGNIIKT